MYTWEKEDGERERKRENKELILRNWFILYGDCIAVWRLQIWEAVNVTVLSINTADWEIRQGFYAS
jgi:hypothetical protein